MASQPPRPLSVALLDTPLPSKGGRPGHVPLQPAGSSQRPEPSSRMPALRSPNPHLARSLVLIAAPRESPLGGRNVLLTVLALLCSTGCRPVDKRGGSGSSPQPCYAGGGAKMCSPPAGHFPAFLQGLLPSRTPHQDSEICSH